MLPPNLYESKGYYQWRNPSSGKRYGLGRSLEYAIREAKAANMHISAPRLIERVQATPKGTLAEYLPIYTANLKARKLSKVTVYNRMSAIRAIAKHMGAVPIAMRQEDTAVMTRACSEFLRTYSDAGKDRMAQYMRAVLVDLFADMAGTWGLPVNPARGLKIARPQVKRERLSLDQYKEVFKVAGKVAQPWVCRAMDLAIVTLQRREDTAKMGFRDVKDGRLCVIQHKTGARLRIPLALRLAPYNLSLGEAINRCKDGIFSPRLLHHAIHQGLAKPGMGVNPQTLGTEFARCRDLAGITASEGKLAPSFHEIRSLGARLYKESGYDPQQLLGHKDAETTLVYLNERVEKWIDVAA